MFCGLVLRAVVLFLSLELISSQFNFRNLNPNEGQGYDSFNFDGNVFRDEKVRFDQDTQDTVISSRYGHRDPQTNRFHYVETKSDATGVFSRSSILDQAQEQEFFQRRVEAPKLGPRQGLLGAIAGGFNQVANSAFGSFGGRGRPNNQQQGFKGNQNQQSNQGGFNNQGFGNQNQQSNQGGFQEFNNQGFGNQNQQSNQGGFQEFNKFNNQGFGNQNQGGFKDISGPTDNFIDFTTTTTIKPKATRRPPIPGLPSEEDDAPKKCVVPVTSSTVPKKPAIPGLPSEEEDACGEDGVGNRIDPNALKSLIG